MPGPPTDPGELEPARTQPHDACGAPHLVPSGHGFRLSKVLAVRHALRTDKYDSDAVLDETVRRLTYDLGIVRPG